MACPLVSSFAMPCRESNGGSAEMKVKVFTSPTGIITETSGTVTMSGAGLSGWKTLYCEKQTANFDDDLVVNVQNGTVVANSVVNFVFNKLQVAFRNELRLYGKNRLWIAIKDNNGVAWLFGFTRGMDLTSGKGSSGTNYTDRSGYVLAFAGMEPDPIVAISNYDSLYDA